MDCRRTAGPGIFFSIHEPVDRYDASMGKRVDRVFAMLQPDQAVWRANLL
ncbi:MAG: DUF3445 domain-containing protein, partial [Moraxellaceae bacterium]